MMVFSSIGFFLCLLKTYLSIFEANLDLVDGRFALFMDERVLYDGVQRILHPKNIYSFWFSVFDANAHLYGRVYWNINALIGFLPDYFFGATGLIFSGRISSVMFLSFSCFFLSIAFLKNWFFILGCFFVLINAPFSSYFMTMPKPEPIQLFFLSLFLYLLKKSNFSLTKKGWFFFGLAIGTKVSILPVSLPVIMFSLYRGFLLNGVNKTLGNITTMAGYVLFGFSVAVPILIKPYIVSFFVYQIANKKIFKNRPNKTFNSLALLLSFLVVNVFYSTISKVAFGMKTGLYRWFTQTILNTGHGFDSADVGFFTWVRYFFTDFISPFPFVNMFLFACAGLLVLSTIKTRGVKRSPLVLDKVVFLLSGLILLFVVFLTAKRIWGFYLFPGFSLLVISMVAICEMNISKKNKLSGKFAVGNNAIKKLSVFFMVLLLSVAIGSWFPQNINEYKKLAARTKTEEYRENHKSFLQIKEDLIVLSKEKNKKIRVKNIGSPFVPDDGEYFSIIGLERPFTQWWAKHEVLLVKNIREVSIKDLNPNILNYDARIKEKKGYDKWVATPSEPCLSEVCYKKIKTFENGTELLILSSKEKNKEN